MPRIAWIVSDLSVTVCGAPPELPNSFIDFLQGVGFGDLACYGSEKSSTTRLDRMAREGTRFTSSYARTAHCPGRVGGWWALRPDKVTVAEVLRAVGYSTARIGNWGTCALPMGLCRRTVETQCCADYPQPSQEQ